MRTEERTITFPSAPLTRQVRVTSAGQAPVVATV